MWEGGSIVDSVWSMRCLSHLKGFACTAAVIVVVVAATAMVAHAAVVGIVVAAHNAHMHNHVYAAILVVLLLAVLTIVVGKYVLRHVPIILLHLLVLIALDTLLVVQLFPAQIKQLQSYMH